MLTRNCWVSSCTEFSIVLVARFAGKIERRFLGFGAGTGAGGASASIPLTSDGLSTGDASHEIDASTGLEMNSYSENTHASGVESATTAVAAPPRKRIIRVTPHGANIIVCAYASQGGAQPQR